jgi:hypothetical protein
MVEMTEKPSQPQLDLTVADAHREVQEKLQLHSDEGLSVRVQRGQEPEVERE